MAILIFTDTQEPGFQKFPIPETLPPNARWATSKEETLISSGVPIKWGASGNVVQKPQSEIDAEQLQKKRQTMAVSAFQAMAALENAGLLEAAETAVANSDKVTQLAWSKAQSFRRTSPTLMAIAPQLGLDDDALDQLFEDAAKIEA